MFIFCFLWHIARVGRRKFRNATRSMNWLSISLIIRSLCNQHTNFIPHSRFFLLPFARSCFSDINKHMPINLKGDIYMENNKIEFPKAGHSIKTCKRSIITENRVEVDTKIIHKHNQTFWFYKQFNIFIFLVFLSLFFDIKLFINNNNIILILLILIIKYF